MAEHRIPNDTHGYHGDLTSFQCPGVIAKDRQWITSHWSYQLWQAIHKPFIVVV